MRKVLVQFHVYYHDQTDYFIEKLRNINGCEWDLYVTMNRHDATTEKKLTDFKPDVKIIQVENRGYDLWPFMKVIKSVNLDDYDYILKLHTKNGDCRTNRINGLGLKNYEWRNELVNSLLKSPVLFRKLLDTFEKRPEVGLICSHLLYKKVSEGLPEDLSELDRELDRLGLDVKERKFCAGTIFMARTRPYKLFQDNKAVSLGTFSEQSRTHSIGSMAHVYERILTMAVSAAGYKVHPVIIDWPKSLYVILERRVDPVIQQIFSIQRLGEDRIKVLTILGIHFRLQGGPILYRAREHRHHRVTVPQPSPSSLTSPGKGRGNSAYNSRSVRE